MASNLKTSDTVCVLTRSTGHPLKAVAVTWVLASTICQTCPSSSRGSKDGCFTEVETSSTVNPESARAGNTSRKKASLAFSFATTSRRLDGVTFGRAKTKACTTDNDRSSAISVNGSQWDHGPQTPTAQSQQRGVTRKAATKRQHLPPERAQI